VNKLLISVCVPILEQEYDMHIPINKKVGTVRRVIVDAISEMSGGYLVNKENLKLYDRKSGVCYDNDTMVKDSDIHNGTKMLLL